MSKIMVYLYFAYGSNLLASRMHINNPTAKRAGVAYLCDHRLDFNYFSKTWGGNAATIVPDKGKIVWGALWEITDLDSLDVQEGVSDNIYFSKQVSVSKLNNETADARTYQLVSLPTEAGKNQPSRVYLETIIQGAVESGLPDEYVADLRKIKHNGFEGPVKIPNFRIQLTETLNQTSLMSN